MFFFAITTSCNKQNNEDFIKQEEFGLSSEQLNYAKEFKGLSAEEVLFKLKEEKKISENLYQRLVVSSKPENRDSIYSKVLKRISTNSVSNSSTAITLSMDRNPRPPSDFEDEILAQAYEYSMLELELMGMSWGCAGAIAGVGLSIAGLFVGGGVLTVAAAAIWGASHVVSVMSLTACAPAEKSNFVEKMEPFETELDYQRYLIMRPLNFIEAPH